MATWQYDLQLIPRAKLVELFGEVSPRLDSETYEVTDWWSGQVCAGYDEVLARFLKEGGSWSEEIRNWGDEQGDFISVVYEENQVTEIRVRIDVRELNHEYLRILCDFARRYESLFLTEDLKLIEPDLNLLLRQIAESDAFAFVEDPATFLNSIKPQ